MITDFLSRLLIHPISRLPFAQRQTRDLSQLNRLWESKAGALFFAPQMH